MGADIAAALGGAWTVSYSGPHTGGCIVSEPISGIAVQPTTIEAKSSADRFI